MPNRTLCDVLEEMRQCDKTKNYSYILGLIEEAQTLGNRMEAALWDQKDYQRMLSERANLKKEIEELRKVTKESSTEVS